jgi:hypothetical protein
VHCTDLRAPVDAWHLPASPSLGLATQLVAEPGGAHWFAQGTATGWVCLWDARFLICANSWQNPRRCVCYTSLNMHMCALACTEVCVRIHTRMHAYCSHGCGHGYTPRLSFPSFLRLLRSRDLRPSGCQSMQWRWRAHPQIASALVAAALARRSGAFRCFTWQPGSPRWASGMLWMVVATLFCVHWTVLNHYCLHQSCRLHSSQRCRCLQHLLLLRPWLPSRQARPIRQPTTHTMAKLIHWLQS